MAKLFSIGFWGVLARVILRNRIVFLLLLIGATILLSLQWDNMRFTYTEANLLPDDHEINQEYNAFLEKFGEEGNLIVMAIQDDSLFTPEVINAWNKLAADIQKNENIEFVVGLNNLKKLKKNNEKGVFEVENLIQDSVSTQEQANNIKNELHYKLPFYEKFLFNKESNTIRTAIYVNKEIVNTPVRKDLIELDIIPTVDAFEKANEIKVRVSGMPYIRTLNSNTIISEISTFIGAALAITSLIFFFFFRSFRATVISMITVVIGVMWTFGFLGLLHYEITVLTAIIPPLIIVIGIPNCIFLINKYQIEVNNHGNKAKSLQRVITKIGNATLMTNMTTAAGFATFMITESKLLKEFGTVASISIIAIFILLLFIHYSYHL